jgi:hypothetical protein
VARDEVMRGMFALRQTCIYGIFPELGTVRGLASAGCPNDAVCCRYVVLLAALGTVPLCRAAGDIAEPDTL